jgi:hypothetical protein
MGVDADHAAFAGPCPEASAERWPEEVECRRPASVYRDPEP